MLTQLRYPRAISTKALTTRPIATQVTVRLGSVAEAQLVDSIEAEIVQSVYAEKEDQQIAFQTCVLESATLHPRTWKGRSKRFCMMPRPVDEEVSIALMRFMHCCLHAAAFLRCSGIALRFTHVHDIVAVDSP